MTFFASPFPEKAENHSLPVSSILGRLQPLETQHHSETTGSPAVVLPAWPSITSATSTLASRTYTTL